MVQQLATAYGTSRNPFRLYAIGFGPVFQGANASSAKTTLQTMQYYAGTQTSASTALPSNQIITGTDSQMSTQHDRHIHQDPAKRRANRSDQVTMPTPVAEFVDVSKTYRAPLRRGLEVEALRGVSFGIEPGEVFAPARPQPGRQDDPAQDPPRPVPSQRGPASSGWGTRSRSAALSRRVGYMHENQAFPRYCTAAATCLEFYGSLSGLSRSVLRTRVPALLEQVGLADRAHEPIARFSKGMVQRLALAQSVLAEPDLLVLDEPMEGLDLSARLLLQEIVAQQPRRRKDRARRLARPRRGGAGLRSAGRARRGTSRLSRFPRRRCCAIRPPGASGRSKRPWTDLSRLTEARHERSISTSSRSIN